MNFDAAKFTNRGGRSNNEDCVGIKVCQDYGAFVVCDGLGGHNDGEIASGIAMEVVTDDYFSHPELDEANIARLLTNANTAILEDKNHARGMKTTLVSLFMNGNEVMWAHVGDSRLYYFSGGVCRFQTKDHSVSQKAVESGEITLGEIRGHVDRNRLLRALGDSTELKPEISEKIAMIPGNAFLLCSDGFWEYVYETEMELELAKTNSAKEWVLALAQRVYSRAPEDHDNYSAVTVIFQ